MPNGICALDTDAVFGSGNRLLTDQVGQCKTVLSVSTVRCAQEGKDDPVVVDRKDPTVAKQPAFWCPIEGEKPNFSEARVHWEILYGVVVETTTEPGWRQGSRCFVLRVDLLSVDWSVEERESNFSQP
jgi:hypothetical protein